MTQSHALDLNQLLSLNIGNTFNNYTELCKFLRVPTATGNAKIAQLAAWQEQFSFTKSGHKITITAIYPSVIPRTSRVDREVESRMFLLLAEVERYTYLKRMEDPDCQLFKVQLSLSDIFLAIGVCNSIYIDNLNLYRDKTCTKYDKNSSSIYSRSIFSSIKYREFCDFFAEVNNRGRKLLDTLLTKVNASYLAEVKKTYLLVYKGNNRSKIASAEEYHRIRAIISSVLTREKYLRTKGGKEVTPNEHNVFLLGKSKEFYKEVCADTWFTDNEIVRFAPMYEFTFTNTLAERLLRYGEVVNLHTSLLSQLENSAAISTKRTKDTISKETDYFRRFQMEEEAVVVELKGARSLVNGEYGQQREHLIKSCLLDETSSEAYLEKYFDIDASNDVPAKILLAMQTTK